VRSSLCLKADISRIGRATRPHQTDANQSSARTFSNSNRLLDFFRSVPIETSACIVRLFVEIAGSDDPFKLFDPCPQKRPAQQAADCRVVRIANAAGMRIALRDFRQEILAFFAAPQRMFGQRSLVAILAENPSCVRYGTARLNAAGGGCAAPDRGPCANVMHDRSVSFDGSAVLLIADLYVSLPPVAAFLSGDGPLYHAGLEQCREIIGIRGQ